MTLFLLASIGLTLIITKSKLFEPLRQKIAEDSKPDYPESIWRYSTWGHFVQCPQGVGYWMGVFFCPLIWDGDGSWLGCITVVTACGATSSFASLLAAHIIDCVYCHAELLKNQLHNISQPTSEIKSVEKQNSPAVDTAENMG